MKILNNTIVHFEIPAEDVETLKRFYEKLFDWKFVEASMPKRDYWVIQTVSTDDEGIIKGPGINGGIFKKESPMQKPTNWISVENIDVYMNKLVDLGGWMIQDKTLIQGLGWTAIGVDPENNQVALLQPEK